MKLTFGKRGNNVVIGAAFAAVMLGLGIGQAVRRVHDIEGAALDAADVKFDVSFLFGGQIKR